MVGSFQMTPEPADAASKIILWGKSHSIVEAAAKHGEQGEVVERWEVNQCLIRTT
jgi:hypothetical protein